MMTHGFEEEGKRKNRDERLKELLMELQTPLEEILGLVRNAYSRAEEPADVRQSLERIDAAGFYLRSRIDTALELLETPAEQPENGGPAGSGKPEAELSQKDLDKLFGRRILLVEDNDIDAEIAGMVLELYGIEAERAENGEACIDMIRENGEAYYHAVLMNLQLPVLDGCAASREIRRLEGEYYSALPIIGVSAEDEEDTVRSASEAGMDAFIVKPFEPEQLVRLLGRLI